MNDCSRPKADIHFFTGSHSSGGVLNKIILLIFILVISSACAPKMGEIHTMPILKSESTAEISIMRNYNIAGSTTRVYPTVNGKKIAGLYTKDYVRFYLKEGKYTFGLMQPDIIAGRWIEENSIEKNVEANKKYYFLLSPAFLSMEIEEINQKDGESRISTSDLVQAGSLSGDPDPISTILIPVGNIMGLDEDD